MKSTKIIVRIILFTVLIVIHVLLLRKCLIWANTSADYETRDIANYGIFIGHAEEYMHEYIERFFPSEISDAFHDVNYVFRSRAVDEYGFEAYLEFEIQDQEYFEQYIQTVTADLLSRPFYFDDTFQEYVVYDESDGFIYDHIQLGREYQDEEHKNPFFQIHYAKIAKILVDHSTRKVIFVALAVHDGGGSDTGFFCEFFNRFGIEPKEYEAYTSGISNLQK